MERLDDNDLKYLVDHIFLPPKLPQKCDPDAHRHDGVLVDYVASTSRVFQHIYSVRTPSEDLKVWDVLSRMLVNMRTLYDFDDGGVVRSKLLAVLERMEVSGESHTVLNILEDFR